MRCVGVDWATGMSALGLDSHFQCELPAVRPLMARLRTPSDALFVYGSFVCLPHDEVRDIDVMCVSSDIAAVERHALAAVCRPSTMIHAYVVPSTEMATDVRELSQGGWWVTKMILGVGALDGGFATEGLGRDCLESFLRLVDLQEAFSTEEAAIAISRALCELFPTFVPAVLSTLLTPARKRVFSDQLRRWLPRGDGFRLLEHAPRRVPSPDVRQRFFRSMARARPGGPGTGSISAREKLDSASRLVDSAAKEISELLGADSLRRILEGIPAARAALSVGQ